jgi:hypothetical protein
MDPLDLPICCRGGRRWPPGSETVLAKLSELLFVEAVRRYAQALPQGQTGWLAGLRDPHVARALALLHHDITRPWNVDDLSRRGRPVAFGAGRPLH